METFYFGTNGVILIYFYNFLVSFCVTNEEIENTTPTSHNSTTVSQNSPNTSHTSTPISQNSTPISQNNTHFSQNSTPISQNNISTSQNSTPVSQNTIPISKAITPSTSNSILNSNNPYLQHVKYNPCKFCIYLALSNEI